MITCIEMCFMRLKCNQLDIHNANVSNNVSVGKTAIVEGVAQILAAPGMLERVDELFDRNEDGDFVKQRQVARLGELAKLCPPRLRNHRVVSLELANLVAGTKYRGEVRLVGLNHD